MGVLNTLFRMALAPPRPVAARRAAAVQALTIQPASRAVSVLPFGDSVGSRATRASGEASPEDATLLALLKSCGIRRVYGVFDGLTWKNACRNAFLYRLPLAEEVPCCTDTLMARAERDAEHADDWWWSNGKPVTAMLYRNMSNMDHGALVQMLFPNGEAPERGDTSIAVTFPRPPRRLLPTLQRAGLAGLGLRVALPASAITLPKVEQWKQAAVARRKADPIVYGVHRQTGRVAVLGSYNVSWRDPEELKVLVEVLNSMAIDIQ